MACVHTQTFSLSLNPPSSPGRSIHTWIWISPTHRCFWGAENLHNPRVCALGKPRRGSDLPIFPQCWTEPALQFPPGMETGNTNPAKTITTSLSLESSWYKLTLARRSHPILLGKAHRTQSMWARCIRKYYGRCKFMAQSYQWSRGSYENLQRWCRYSGNLWMCFSWTSTMGK